MTFRTAYEILLIGLGLVVGWKFIFTPLYTIVTRRSLRTAVDTSANDELQEAQKTLVDERIRRRASELVKQSQSLRDKRTKSEESK